MSKRSNIKWRQADRVKLAKTVRKFNSKRTRLIKQVPELADILPAKANIQEIMKTVSTRNDFNRKIKSLERFMRKGAENTVTTKEGVVTTRYQLREIQINLATINRRRAQLRKQANVSHEKGTMGAIERMGLEPKANNSQTISKEYWDRYVQSVEKQTTDTYYERKNDIYVNNYIKALNNELGDSDEYKDIVEVLNKLNTDEVVQAYYDNPDLQIDFVYSKEQAQIRARVILDSWREYLNEL